MGQSRKAEVESKVLWVWPEMEKSPVSLGRALRGDRVSAARAVAAVSRQRVQPPPPHAHPPSPHPRPCSPPQKTGGFLCKTATSRCPRRRHSVGQRRQGMGGSYSHITSAGFCRCLDVTVSPCLMHIPAGRMKSPGMGRWKRRRAGRKAEGRRGSGEVATGPAAPRRVPNHEEMAKRGRSCVRPALRGLAGTSPRRGRRGQQPPKPGGLRWVSPDTGAGSAGPPVAPAPRCRSLWGRVPAPGDPVPLCLIR